MSEIGKLRALNWELSKHLAIQQALLRTLGVLCLVRLSSSPDDVRNLADLWHQLIDADQTTSATPALLREEESEFARQYVDALATIAAIRKEWEG